MNYQTYEPHTDLSYFVKCYWTLEAEQSSASEKQRIVPDGCMEMIFHYGDLYKQYLNNHSCVVQPRCFVFGQITTPLDIEPTGTTGIFAVRFHPDGFLPFAKRPLKEMENKAVAISELFGENGDALSNCIVKSISVKERIHIIETFLLHHLQSQQAFDQLARASIEALLQSKGQVNVEVLAEQLNVNRRQLERRFSSLIGMSPKQLSKIIRLQSAFQLMTQKQYTSLTALAYETGYFDQAHFIKDFKEFTGVSPKDFYAGNLRMSSLFSGTE